MPVPRVLIIPGLGGSGPDHWQTRWEDERVDCRRVDLGDWDDPDPLGWIAHIDRAVARAGAPVVLVAHSLGCVAVAAWATLSKGATTRRVEAILVAPCDPVQEGAVGAIQRFAAFAATRLPIPTTVVASSNDPYASIGRAYALAGNWGSVVIEAGEVGHINAQSRLGSWRWGQDLLDRTIARIGG